MIVRPSANADLAAVTAIYADSVLHGTGTFELDVPSEVAPGCARRAWPACPDRGNRRAGGVGKALLNALISGCAAQGMRQMAAVIGDSANTGSIALHEAADFAHVGVFRDAGWKFDSWCDVVFMQRAPAPAGRPRPTPAAWIAVARV